MSTTIKELFNKVKAAFIEPVIVPAIVPVQATSQIYKTSDGTEISIEIKDPAVTVEPTVGDMVMVAGMPATAGDIVLEDGSTLVIADGGMIAEIKPIEPVTQPEAEAELAAPAVVPPAGPTVEERLAAIESKLAAMEMAAQGAAPAMTAQMAKQDNVISGLFELVEQMTKEPTAEPKTLTGAKKDQFDKAAAREKKFEGYAKAIKDLKTK